MPLEVASEPLFDGLQIEMLCDAVGPDDLGAMLAELPRHAARSCEAIEAALASDDFEQACRAAHVLKGVASSFGAARLAAIARQMELESPSVAALRRHMPVLAEITRSTAAALGELTLTSEAGAE